MTLGAPLGLLALLAAPALIAAYFLRRRQPPRTVSALFLWRTPDQRAEAGPRLQRFSRERSLLLELLAVLVATFFLADVKCGREAVKQHVVIVLDGSVSMNAEGVLEKAKTEVARIARAENAGVLTLVESGLKPSLIAGPQLETGRALSTLEKWKPSQPAHDFSAAFTLAKELAGSQERKVFFITDGALELVPSFIEGLSVGTARENAAFLSAQRRDEGGVAQITVRVGNFSDSRRRVQVRFAPEDGKVEEREVTLDAGGTVALRVNLKTDKQVEVTLPDDALTDDGHLTLLPSPLNDVTVSIALPPSEAFNALKRLFPPGSGVRFAEPAQLTIGPPGSTARFQIGTKGELHSFVGPFFAQKSHPLLDDVQLGGVLWTAGESPPGHVLMSAGETVLISEEEDGTLHFNLDLSRSNVSRTVAWPVMMGNLLRLARLSAPGFPRKHLMLGEDVPLVTEAGAKWELEGAEVRPVIGSGVLTLPPLPSGKWALTRDGKDFDAVMVLPIDPRESDLRTRGAWRVEAKNSQTLASLVDTHQRPWWPLAIVLLLLLADFWLTAAPRRVEAQA